MPISFHDFPLYWAGFHVLCACLSLLLIYRHRRLEPGGLSRAQAGLAFFVGLLFGPWGLIWLIGRMRDDG